MKMTRIFISLLVIVMFSCRHYPSENCIYPVANDTVSTITRIAFGSCSKQHKDQPILYKIADLQPDVFIYLGDNIYADTEDMEEMRGKYALLSCKDEFQYLMASNLVLATWDDHDYGANDAGNEYPKKTESKQQFLEFWQEPPGSDRWNHDGIYTSYYFGDSLHRVQIILLDMRTFRSPLSTSWGEYVPDHSPDKTFLGNEQWIWLEGELNKHAMIRIIGTSIQFCSEENGDEQWNNFPNEQQKLVDMIISTQANGLFFISGDVHYAEATKRNFPNVYPFYDFTSSGLTQVDPIPDGNQYRLGSAYAGKNFGVIDIDWQISDPSITYSIYNDAGGIVSSWTLNLSELQL